MRATPGLRGLGEVQATSVAAKGMIKNSFIVFSVQCSVVSGCRISDFKFQISKLRVVIWGLLSLALSSNGRESVEMGSNVDSVPFLEAAEFEGALLHCGGVAIQTDGQLKRCSVLGVDDLLERSVVFAAQIFVVGDYRLQLAHQPVDDEAANKEQEAECGEEKPAVVH
ncbi:MAG: hypothetical protein JWO95_1903 [Verrucomicrobiales bacterium]|nr:hypothetical protein [Verrucomicrobiales bacterium]